MKKNAACVKRSLYNNLKKKYNDLWDVYVELRKRTKHLGISDNDILIGDEEKLG